MKMIEFWPRSKATTLVFSEKITHIEIRGFDRRLKADEHDRILVKMYCNNFCAVSNKWPILELRDFDLILLSDEISEL